MRCPNCDSELPAGAKFCDACGAPINAPIPDMSIPDPATGELPTSPEPAGDTPPEPPVPPVSPEPAFNPEPIPSPVWAAPAEEKVLGMAPASVGLIAIILSAVGIVSSCVGCGGLFGLFGAIAGYLTLKTSGKDRGKIGLILGIIAVVMSIIFICIYVVSLAKGVSTSN